VLIRAGPPNGQRILPEGWVDYSRRSTLGSIYGAGFWTNDGPSAAAAWRVARGFPKDGFFASGILYIGIFRGVHQKRRPVWPQIQLL